MKKVVLILTILTSFFLVSCKAKNTDNIEAEIIEIKPDDLITMEILDDYMGRTDVQYVDLRNMEAKFRSGYIKGFELIPFFDYLDNRVFLRNNSYDFSGDQIINEELIRMYFDQDKAIFLYADGCIRSNYIKEVLNHLGYDRVYVLGGYYEYTGQYNVLGDGLFTLGSSEYVSTVSDNGTEYHISVKYDMGRLITDIRIDIVDPTGLSYRNDESINNQLTIIENFIISDMISIYDLYHLISVDDGNSYHSIEGYEFGYSEDLIALFFILMTE